MITKLYLFTMNGCPHCQEMKKLPEKERTVLVLYYEENLTLGEIGDVLGVTESRVSQIHTKAVLQMRARLRAADVG